MPPNPGDTTLLKQAQQTTTKSQQTKHFIYTCLQLFLGIVLYAPNVQQFLDPESRLNLSKWQCFCLIFGGLMALHAVTKLLLLLYGSIFNNDNFTVNLSSIQSKLLGINASQANKQATEPGTADQSTNKTNPNFSKSFNELDTQALLDDSILIGDTLPKINQPLINEKFRTPTKPNSGKISNFSSPNKSRQSSGGKSDKSNSRFGLTNRSFMSQDTTELLNSPKFKNIPFNLNESPDSLMVNGNTSFSRLLNDDSMDESDLEPNQTNPLKSNMTNNSFYSGTGKSFINSFEESFSRSRAQSQNNNNHSSGNLHNVSSISQSSPSRFVNENAYRNAWNENIVPKVDHSQIKGGF